MFARYLRPIVAALLIGLAIPAALALNVDQNRTIPARQHTTQQVSYYRITVNFNDPNISTAQKFGRLLRNTFITNIACHVTTAFNAVTTNVFTVGTDTTATDLIDAATSTKSIDETSATYQTITSATSLGVRATSGADVDLYAKYTQTGTAATAGQVTCIFAFIPNNDMQ